ncbi:hypothetical protein CDD83_8298 [Cordyceps sp. RAO-2017]|nr:hypothetical protein CDD83_8298 [Cordyceps sp. RAO-2017]
MATPSQDASVGPAQALKMPADSTQTKAQANKADSGQAKPVTKPQKVSSLHQLGDGGPQWIDCPFCQQRAPVTIRRVGTAMQTMAALLFCMFCCVCLTCVPFLAHWFENTEYVCSNCDTVVAIRPHDGPMQLFDGRQTGPPLVPS